MPVRIALDAMGGDHAPAAAIEGAVEAARTLGEEVQILLVGQEAVVREGLDGYEGAAQLPIRVVDAPEVIGMGEAPAAAVKTKTRSSIHVGLGLQKQGHADAFVSAGNTGAVMAASLFLLGRQPGILRPAVVGFFPTVQSYCIMVDVGSNVDCKPEHLVQFAQMGHFYARDVMQRPEPAVALLNLGSEPGKGNELAKAAYELLAATPGINFRGNIEGRDVMAHAADVIVTDGFVGNVMLKLGEGMATAFLQMVTREMARQGLSEAEQGLLKRVLGNVYRRFDYEAYGGAPLLGVAGNVLIGHGSSHARAFTSMVRTSVELVRRDLAGTIAQAINA